MGSNHTDFAALDAAIEAALEAQDHGRILGLVAANLSESAGAPHLVSYVGAALVAVGRIEDAADLYHDLAVYAAEINRPLDAIMAIRALADLTPDDAADLSARVADMYSAGSSHLEAGTTPVGLPADGAVLVEPIGEDVPLDVLAENAQFACQAVTHGERAYIQASPVPLLSDLNTEDFVHVIEFLQPASYFQGHELIVPGEPVTGIFWVARGAVKVSHLRHGDRALTGPNIMVGVESLFGEKAEVGVRCLGACDVLFLDKDDLAELLNGHAQLRECVRHLVARYEIHQAISRCELFRQLPPGEHAHLLAHFTAHRVPAGQVLIREGARSPGLFIVTHGQVDLRINNGDASQLLEPLQSGDLLGLLGLENDEPAPVSAVTATNSRVLFLEAPRLRHVLDEHPDARALLGRLRAARAAHLIHR